MLRGYPQELDNFENFMSYSLTLSPYFVSKNLVRRPDFPLFSEEFQAQVSKLPPRFLVVCQIPQRRDVFVVLFEGITDKQPPTPWGKLLIDALSCIQS